MNYRYIFLFMAIFILACSASTVPQAANSLPRPSTPAPTVYEVCTASLNLRSCAGTNCESLAVLPTGAQMTASAAVTPPTGGEWRRVVLAGGETGWVNARYICEVK